MELRQLATFAAVAEEGSFTRAAGRLHVVQSAVSATVRTLERELGVTLFDRTTHRVELSAAGRVLLPEARRTLAAAAAARDAIDELRGGLRGTVRLGVMLSQRVPAVSVPRLLAALRAEHPGIEVELRLGGSGTNAEDVRRGRLDLAVIGLPHGTARGLRLTTLAEQEMQVVLPLGHPLAGRSSVTLPELEGETFVDGPPDWGSRIATDRAFAAAGSSRTVAYEVADMAGLVEFVHYGLAVAIVMPAIVDAAADVRVVPIHPHAPRFTTSLAAPLDRELGAPARALLELAAR
jgi:DNA-binding transcriptional LysR family regulator